MNPTMHPTEPEKAQPEMTLEQARIVVLEDALEQAQNTVEFLHGCLTTPGYKYEYPEHTQDDLKEWAELVPRREYCIHSVTEKGCPSCAARNEHMRRLYAAKARIESGIPDPASAVPALVGALEDIIAITLEKGGKSHSAMANALAEIRDEARTALAKGGKR